MRQLDGRLYLNSQTKDDDDANSRASLTDRDILEGWRRDRRAESLRPLLERYGGFVYSSAYRRTVDAEAASEVTRAVFLVLARRAHRLRKIVLAGWLFQVTAVACRRAWADYDGSGLGFPAERATAKHLRMDPYGCEWGLRSIARWNVFPPG